MNDRAVVEDIMAALPPAMARRLLRVTAGDSDTPDHQPPDPDSPLNGPANSGVIQPA